MAFDYSEIATSVDEILTEFGQSVTVSRKTAGTYDEETGIAAVSTSTQTVIGAVFEWNNKDVDGTLVRDGDMKLLLSPKTTAGATLTRPAANDQVTIGGKAYSIVAVKPLSPAGTAVMYECNIRGAT